MFEPKDYRATEHAVVTTLTTEGQDVLVSWESYDGDGFDVQPWHARLRWDGSTMAVVTAYRVGSATAPARVHPGRGGKAGVVLPVAVLRE